MHREADEHHEQRLARRRPSTSGAFALLRGTGHAWASGGIEREATGEREGWPGHQPVVQVLIGEAPERPQQAQQQQGFLRVAARTPAGTGRQRGRTAPVGQLNGEPTQREQMQAIDEREGVDVQRRAHTRLPAMICWGRDGYLGLVTHRQHGLTSGPREHASTCGILPHVAGE